MERGSVNEAIVFGGVAVAPGDLVIGDDDGLVFVPRAMVDPLLAPCEARVDAEDGWQAQLDGGLSTIEVFGVPAAVVRP
jgi:regulator of RNase E activity RraA